MAFRYYFMHFPQPSSSLNESHQRGERTKDSGFDASETVGFETRTRVCKIQGPDGTMSAAVHERRGPRTRTMEIFEALESMDSRIADFSLVAN